MNERTRLHINYLLMGWFGAIIGGAVGGYRWLLFAFLGYWFVVAAVSLLITGTALAWRWFNARHGVIDPGWSTYQRTLRRWTR